MAPCSWACAKEAFLRSVLFRLASVKMAPVNFARRSRARSRAAPTDGFMQHRARILAGLLATLLAGAGAPAGAQQRPPRLEVSDFALGSGVDQLPDEFVDLACGTNGGPPSVPLNGWNDFRRCRPEPSGLREVYFRYDDELEYWAKANNLADQMEQFSGTKTYGFPVIVSILIDAEGTVGGIR